MWILRVVGVRDDRGDLVERDRSDLEVPGARVREERKEQVAEELQLGLQPHQGLDIAEHGAVGRVGEDLLHDGVDGRVHGPKSHPLPPDIEVLDGHGSLDERVFEPVYPDHPGDVAEPFAREVAVITPDPLPPLFCELVFEYRESFSHYLIMVENPRHLFSKLLKISHTNLLLSECCNQFTCLVHDGVKFLGRDLIIIPGIADNY